MGKKEKCKEIMMNFFGPATAKIVDSMNENEAITKCKEKVIAFLGEDKAKVFDSI